MAAVRVRSRPQRRSDRRELSVSDRALSGGGRRAPASGDAPGRPGPVSAAESTTGPPTQPSRSSSARSLRPRRRWQGV